MSEEEKENFVYFYENANDYIGSLCFEIPYYQGEVIINFPFSIFEQIPLDTQGKERHRHSLSYYSIDDGLSLLRRLFLQYQIVDEEDFNEEFLFDCPELEDENNEEDNV